MYHYPEIIKLIRRRKRKPKVGDYVFAHRWVDADLRDPWAVGFIEIVDDFRSPYQVLGRRYRHAHKINQQEGEEILSIEKYFRY